MPTQSPMEFKDTGKGMSAELQKRAFTAVLSTTKAKGTGLGLAIVGRIIETHRGEHPNQIQNRSRHLNHHHAAEAVTPPSNHRWWQNWNAS